MKLDIILPFGRPQSGTVITQLMTELDVSNNYMPEQQYQFVADSFIPEQVRYLCPTIVILKFLRAYIPTYKRQIWNFKMADYEKNTYLIQIFSEILKMKKT